MKVGYTHYVACVFMFVIVSLMLLSGCTLFFGKDGEDGEPGNAYIAYSWVSVPLYLSTNDPSMPQSIYNHD